MTDEKRNAAATDNEAGLKTPVCPGSAALRRALRGNIVSFPTRIPILLKQPQADMQWRMVLLFFVRGWSSASIAGRFGVPKHRIRRSLNEWSFRALALGHVQIIDPEAFVECCQVDVEYGAEHDIAEARTGGVTPALGVVPQPMPAATPAIAVQAAIAPRALPPELRPVDLPRKSADVLGALDSAIARCEQWRGEFWMHLAIVLRDMRAAAALQASRSSGSADGLFAAFAGDEVSSTQGFESRVEERVYHAVA